MQRAHRDLKPENILLSTTCPEQPLRVCLCDFGFAKNLQSAHALGSHTSYVATRWYRAPEQLLGLPYNSTVDIWALGCCLYEMYTGQALFQGDTSLAMLQAIHAVVDLTDVLCAYRSPKHAAMVIQLSRGGTSPILEQAQLPLDLHEVVLACLCADPAERPSARELLSYRCSYVLFMNLAFSCTAAEPHQGVPLQDKSCVPLRIFPALLTLKMQWQVRICAHVTSRGRHSPCIAVCMT